MTPNKFSTILLASAFVLTPGCAVLDRINPFDETNADIREAQGEVEGERIPILTLDDTLEIAGTLTPNDVVLPAAYVNAEWPQVGGNAEHNLQHTAVGDGETLDRVWSRNIGKSSGRKGRILAPPVIANGVIYAFDADNTVVAMDAASGDKLWDRELEKAFVGKSRQGSQRLIDRIENPLGFLDRGGSDKESVGGGLAVAGDTLYATSGLGLVTAMDARTGEPIWEELTRTPMHSAPTVSGGRVFATSDDNEIFAFNAADGAVLWTYQGIIESARMLTVPAPAVTGDVVLAPFASGELVALRAQNGGVLWQDALSSTGRLTPLASLSDISGGPVVVDGFVLASSQSGTTAAFDLRTGQRIWAQPAGSLGIPLVLGDFVYLATTSGQLVCLSKLDGTVVWLTELPAFENPKKRKDPIAYTSPVAASGRLVTYSSRGREYILSPQTGAILSDEKGPGDVFVPPVVADGTLYVMTDDAKLVAYR